MTQQEALDILKMGRNVFLTGEPGSGKTHTIHQYVSYLRSNNIEPAITASTGISATHIGGLTIHSWSGIGIKNTLDKHELKKIALSRYIAKRVKRAKVLIIDEISMLSSEIFSMIDTICREIKQNSEPFGGMQVVLVGDFFQLPPIIKTQERNDSQIMLLEESSGRFAYDSPVWQKAKLFVCYLTEQHRQNDKNFLSVLSAIRSNNFNDTHLHYIEDRKVNHNSAPNTAPKLFSFNVDVDRVNNEILSEIDSEPQIFKMFSQGPEPLVAVLKKGCLSPNALCLKIGAAVMFTKNNLKEKFVNGTLGIVEKFIEHTKEPIVKTRDGRRIKVKTMDWTIEENGKVRARITQLPLRLAWAITVHKSQGMSLDEAVMDLSNVFEFGQGYVALSRVRRLSGLYLLGWNEHAFKVHPEVLEKDAEFQKQSEEALYTFSNIAENDITIISENFVRLCGGVARNTREAEFPDLGKIVSEKNITAPFSPVIQTTGLNGAPVGFEKIRQTHPNAYLPWEAAQDIKLRELFIKGSSIAELTEIFNRTRGAIKSRLTKLELFND